MKLYRAIKRIPKHIAQTASLSLKDGFPAEAELLKNLHHPGIPLIYDIDEDSDFIYMVEEYIQGESLDLFLSHQKDISQELIFQLGIQICDILDYLHHLSPFPILYQDLKPEHIILCGNQFKLVDFGIASYITGSDNQFQYYGTDEFAAPEARNGMPVTPSCDIYSLGKIFQYIAASADIHCSASLLRIIDKAASVPVQDRYKTAADLKTALVKVCHLSYRQHSHLIKNIAVAGSRKGVGVTHIAVSLVNVLNKKGFSAVYCSASQPENSYFADNSYPMEVSYAVDGDYFTNRSLPTGKTFPLTFHHTALREKSGIYTCGNFKGVPAYGEGIEDPVPEDDIRIRDFSLSASLTPESLEDADVLLAVLSGSDWDIAHSLAFADRLNQYRNVIFICNYGNQKGARHLAHLLKKPVCCFPCDPDPYRITTEKERLVSAICEKKGGHKKFGTLIKKRIKSHVTIGLVGCCHGVGVTHLAISLSSYCSSKLRKRTACLELHSRYELASLLPGKTEDAPKQKEQAAQDVSCTGGAFFYHGVSYYPNISKEAIPNLLNCGYDYLIFDLGSMGEASTAELLRCDIKLVLGSLAPWKTGYFRQFFLSFEQSQNLREGFFYLVQMGNVKSIHELSRTYHVTIRNIPFIRNPFRIQKEQFLFLQELLP